MAILQNQGTLLYTPVTGEQQSLNTNITTTEVSVTYGMAVYHSVTPDSFAVGDTVSYTVVVENTASGSLYTPNVSIGVTGGTLTLVPESVTAFLFAGGTVTPVPVSVTGGAPFGFLLDTVIPTGGFVYLNYDATVTAASGDLVVSTATVGANEGSATGPVITDSDDAAITRTALSVIKTAPAVADVGDTISYQFTVLNTSAEQVSLDALTDQLPAGFSFTGAALVVGGVVVPLEAGVDYTVTPSGLFTLSPATPINLPAGTTAQLTLTGVVTA